VFFHSAFSLGTRTLKISVGTFASDLRIHHLNYLCIRTNEPWPLIEPRTVWLVLVILVVQCEYIYGGNNKICLHTIQGFTQVDATCKQDYPAKNSTRVTDAF